MFQNGKTWILLTTDRLARGVDFKEVKMVIQYDIPKTKELYFHRAGRTGRQEHGICLTLYSEKDKKGLLKDVVA